MLLNYTTDTPVDRTLGEIQKLLSGHNVSAMMTEYVASDPKFLLGDGS